MGIVVDASGRIIVAGQKLDGSGNDDLLVLRFNGDGTLDTTFNAGVTPGYFVHNNTAGGKADDLGFDVTVDVNDRILVTGFSQGTGRDMAIWRFNP